MIGITTPDGLVEPLRHGILNSLLQVASKAVPQDRLPPVLEKKVVLFRTENLDRLLQLLQNRSMPQISVSIGSQHEAKQSDPADESFLLFSYGSNSFEQLCQRVGAQTLPDHKAACLVDAALAFFGPPSKTWGGGVATLVPEQGGLVRGTVARLTQKQRSLLDRFEGVHLSPPKYNLRPVVVNLKDGECVDAFAYIGDFDAYKASATALATQPPDLQTRHALPSYAYLNAIHRNLSGCDYGALAYKGSIPVRPADLSHTIGFYCPDSSTCFSEEQLKTPVKLHHLVAGDPPQGESSHKNIAKLQN